MQSSEDWYQTDNSKIYGRNATRAKQCTVADFGDEQDKIDIFESWAGFSLLCPNLEEYDFKLQNTLGNNITKYMSFEVRRCVNSTEN